jgi:hypothetical protein
MVTEKSLGFALTASAAVAPADLQSRQSEIAKWKPGMLRNQISAEATKLLP